MATMNLFDSDAPQQDLISLDAIRRRADNLMLTLIWALWLVSLAAGFYHDDSWLALIAGSALAIAATLLKALFHGTRPVRVGYAVILLAFAALLIQIGEGETEYHFSVFVLMSALLAWRDWLPLLVGAGVAAVHHLVFNYLQEWGLFGIKVFIHPGLHMVIFHGLFVVMQTAVLIFLAIRMEQDARTASEVAQLAAIINREPGCLTLAADDHSSSSTFARTFSTTLDTMRNTLQQASRWKGHWRCSSETPLCRHARINRRPPWRMLPARWSSLPGRRRKPAKRPAKCGVWPLTPARWPAKAVTIFLLPPAQWSKFAMSRCASTVFWN
ncbi:MAG TPA: hypothetical protein VJS14_03880 [Enterobacteriaceae bacterium]|nr:hypothetical protein [Enterobacteriaceae bacterium]